MIDVEEILSKMNPNQKINYDRVMQKMVKVWKADQKRPTILMHTCCAPCSTYVFNISESIIWTGKSEYTTWTMKHSIK